MIYLHHEFVFHTITKFYTIDYYVHLEQGSGNSGNTSDGTSGTNLTGSVGSSGDSGLLGSRRGGDVGGGDGARTGNSQGGGLGDSDGLVVDDNVGRLRAVGGEVSDNNVGGDGDVTSGDVSSQSKRSGDLGELHCSKLKRVTVGKEKSFRIERSGDC